MKTTRARQGRKCKPGKGVSAATKQPASASGTQRKVQLGPTPGAYQRGRLTTTDTDSLPPHIVQERRAIFAALECVVPMLGATIGAHIEVVLHDLTQPESSIRAIANGHITNRRCGGTLLAGPGNDKALAMLADIQAEIAPGKHVTVAPYSTYTRDNRTLTSSTVIFRDSAGNAFAALCLNADYSGIEAAQAMLARLLPNQTSEHEHKKAEAPDIEALMHEIIEDAVSRFGKPVASLSKDEKVIAVATMLERGLFVVKGGVEKAANALGVTRFTIYNYLDIIKARRQEST